MKSISRLLILAALALSSAPAAAQQSTLTPTQLLQQLGRPALAGDGLVGKRSVRLWRAGTAPLVISAEVAYADADDYALTLTAPESLKGTRFTVQKGVTTALFPSDNVLLSHFVFPLPGDFLLSLFSSRLDLLAQNYTTRILSSNDTVNGTQAYQVEFIPKNTTVDADGSTPLALTPRRRVWLDRRSLQVLSETRFWDGLTAARQWSFSDKPYAELGYERYQPGARPAVTAPSAAGTKAIRLSGQRNGAAMSYTSLTDAQAREGLPIQQPAHLPKGFALEGIQVYSLASLRVPVLNYTDGLNRMSIVSIPVENAFTGMLESGLSLNLMGRLSDLSLYAPYNYHTAQTDTTMAMVFGDVAPIELQRVAESMSL